MKYILTVKPCETPFFLPIEHAKDVHFDKFDTSCKEKGLVLVAFYLPDTSDTRASVLSHYKFPNGLIMG